MDGVNIMCKKEWVNIQNGKVLNKSELIKLANNTLLKIRPELWCEWDFEKNNELGLDIRKVTKALKLDSHWICNKGHKFMTKIANRGKGSNCRICNGKEVLIGYNDIYTTNKEVALLMLNEEDMYKYTKSSDSKVDFKCNHCNTIKRNVAIKEVTKRGLKCVMCSDGYSYPEKIMYNILINLNIDFNFDRKTKWSNNRRFDFYIPSLNMIIEMHGFQHYGKGFNTLTDRDDACIDSEKRKLALGNGVEKYIEIDCRYSDFEFIKNNIIKSLSHLLPLYSIDWEVVMSNSMKSMMINTLELWESGIINVKDIADKLKIHEGTVYSYLRSLSKLGKCNANDVLIGNKRKVVQLTVQGEYIRTFNSTYEASDFIGGNNHTNIINTCKNKRNVCKGYNWMYEEDYLKFKEENKVIPLAKKKQEVPVVQLSINGEYIKEYISRVEAQKETGTNVNSIRRCCQGTLKSAGGFRWMTVDEYNNIKDNNLLIEEYTNNTGGLIPVVQLDKDYNFIKEFKSASHAEKENNKFRASSIRRCCKGYLKSVSGFKWMNKEDYEKLG